MGNGLATQKCGAEDAFFESGVGGRTVHGRMICRHDDTVLTEKVSCTYFGKALSSSRTFSEARNCWLRPKSRSTSRRRCLAPSASLRARSARLLATSAVTRNANKATQFWGSAIVKVPKGGRKKKLKAAVA